MDKAKDKSIGNPILRGHEDWYYLLFDHANDAIFVYQRTPEGYPGKMLDVNQAACEMLGYSREELLKLTMFDITSPERHVNYDGFRKALDADKHIITQTVKTAKDGTNIYTELSSHLFDLDGIPTVLSIVRDITDRKKVEDELRDSQQRYFTLVNSAYDGISLHEMRAKGGPGKYIDVNDALCQRVGYTRRELLKLTPWDIVEKRGMSRISQLRDEIMLKKGIIFDITELSKDGTTRPVEVTARLLELKGKYYVLSISRDMTERKLVEDELRDSEERYRMLFNSGADALMVHEMNMTDHYGKFVEVNDNACRMLGYNREQLLNMGPMDLVAPDKKPQQIAPRHHILQKDQPMFYETIFVAAGGKRFPVEIRAHGFDYKGRTLVVAVIRDISERKEAENSLREAQEKLARSEKLAALGQMASGIAHDIGTPLTVVTNVVDYLKEQLTDADEIIKTQLERLDRQTNVVSSIAHDLLDFAKVRVPEREEVKITAVVQKAVELVHIPQNIAFTVEHEDDTCSIMADPDQMMRVFTNMITNAIKSMPNGGSLLVQTRRLDVQVQIAIMDTGVGIPAGNLDRIFEPLFTTRSKGGSIGIGLAICKSIVEAHDGVIEVESKQDIGTTFTIKLPCAA